MMLVPWITLWSGEDKKEARRCRFADGELAAWRPHKPGAGVPLLAERHPVRIRRAVHEMLCGVCGKATAADDRWFMPIGYEMPNGLYAILEPPSHIVCAEIAASACPHLRKKGLTPFRYGGELGRTVASIDGDSAASALGAPFRRDRRLIVETYLTMPAAIVRRHLEGSRK